MRIKRLIITAIITDTIIGLFLATVCVGLGIAIGRGPLRDPCTPDAAARYLESTTCNTDCEVFMTCITQECPEDDD